MTNLKKSRFISLLVEIVTLKQMLRFLLHVLILGFVYFKFIIHSLVRNPLKQLINELGLHEENPL